MSLFKRVVNIVRGKVLDAQQEDGSDVDAIVASEMSNQALKGLHNRSHRTNPAQNHSAETSEVVLPDSSSQPKKRTL